MHILSKGVYFVSGAKRGAIYDTNTGNVYSLNEAASWIVVGKRSDPIFWERLRFFGLAEGESARKLTEQDLKVLKRTFGLKFIWFEVVSDDCNQSCVHCYADSMPPSYRRIMGLKPEPACGANPQERKLTYAEWLTLIEEGFELGCRSCQFIGGEPFLYKGEGGETVLDLAAYAKSAGYTSVEVFTNGTLLTREKIELIKSLGIEVATSLYSVDPEIHDLITRTPGSLQRLMQVLGLLREFEVPTRIATVLMSTNQATIEETSQWIEEAGFRHRRPDPIRPAGRGDNPELFPSAEMLTRYGLMLKPNFKVDLEVFSRYLRGHSCLAGKIAITDTGDVLPCIFSRSQMVGNVVEDASLEEIVKGNALREVWHATKDHVLVCRDCEYRYACRDCRPLSEGAANGNGDYFTAPYPRCTYNPYTGEWGGGVWKLDGSGKPYYDRNLRSVTAQVLGEGEGDGRGESC